jgi:LacI family transcriptional regulator
MRRDGAKVIPPRPFADRRTWGAFCEWLGSLPAGTGVFTGIDLIASHVMPILHMNGCNVPDEIAVISAGDDEVICETLHPSLSSIKLGGERVGFRAAEIMAGMMRGAPAPAEPVRLPPLHVAERRSTDCLFFDDPVLTQAVRFLRAHACDPIDVSDVLREVPVSRRWLEKHFREELGTTPHREIQRMRLHRAKRLLLRTDLTMEAIRQECGYQTVQHFGAAFKTCTGLPPAAYRASKRVEA